MKKLIEALKNSEEEWHSLVKHVSDMVVIVDKEGIIRLINRTPPGFSVKKAIGERIYDYIDPDHHKLAKETINRVFQTGKAGNYKSIAPGPHESDSWYMNKVKPIKEKGQVVSAMLITTDITEQIKAKKRPQAT